MEGLYYIKYQANIEQLRHNAEYLMLAEDVPMFVERWVSYS
jgi:hypothetical protein